MLPKPTSLELPCQRHPTAQPPSPAWHTEGPSSQAPCLASNSPFSPLWWAEPHFLSDLPSPRAPCSKGSHSPSHPLSPSHHPPHCSHCIPPALPRLPHQTISAAPRGGPVPAGKAVCPSPTSPWTEAYPPILVALPLGPRASWGCTALALPQGLCLPRGSRIAHSATRHPHAHPYALCPFAPQTSGHTGLHGATLVAPSQGSASCCTDPRGPQVKAPEVTGTGKWRGRRDRPSTSW